MATAASSRCCAAKPLAPSRVGRGSAVTVRASWQKATTKTELASAGGKQVVELSGTKVLLVEDGGEVFAVSNKCSHLGLPIVGKTAFFQGEVKERCVVCPAHGTAFDLATGAVKGEWCPKFPNLPLVGKVGAEKPLPTYKARVSEAGVIEVDV